jgi:hypothetical protein
LRRSISMTDKARETIAALIGVECEASVYGGITGTYDAADAILAALPSIIADMVGPLEFNRADLSAWGEYALTGLGEYRMYWEYGTGPNNEDVFYRMEYNGVSLHSSWDEEAAVEAANAHNRAAILKSLGMKEQGKEAASQCAEGECEAEVVGAGPMYSCAKCGRHMDD